VRGYVDRECAQSEEITPALHRQRTGALARARQFLAYLAVAVLDPGVTRGLNLGPGK
jgi:cardiolipin synthase